MPSDKQIRAAFEARWQAAIKQPEVVEVQQQTELVVLVTPVAMIARLCQLADAAYDNGHIDAEARDAAHAAAERMRGVFKQIPQSTQGALDATLERRRLNAAKEA
ncbi:MAG: hypothetical protein ACFB3T_12935 [Geminicoccaceae bacterium]